MSIKFFRSQARFRSWLERNYAAVDELWVGFFKKDSGKPSISYKEAVDEALCFGWIDGVRKSIDGVSYTVRFTPRRPRSTWSRINIDRAKELKSLGRMTPTGWQVFQERDPNRAGLYSFENPPRELDNALAKHFRLCNSAWEFFQQQPPGYRRTAIFWIMSAKKEETRLRRLEQLIRASEGGRRLGVVTGASEKPSPASRKG